MPSRSPRRGRTRSPPRGVGLALAFGLCLGGPAHAEAPPAPAPDVGVEEPGRILGMRPRTQLITVGAISGATAGALVEHALPFPTGAPAWLGIGMGAAPGLIYRRADDLPASAGIRSLSFAALGTWTGWELGGAIDANPDARPSRRAAMGGAIGDLGAWTLSMASPPRGHRSTPEWLALDLSTSAGLLAAGGAWGLAVEETDRPALRAARAAVHLLGGYGGLATGLATHPRLSTPRALLFGAQGAWLGAWIPTLARSGPSQPDPAGARLGAGLGLLASTLVHSRPERVGDATAMAAGAVSGAAIGRGLPLAIAGPEAGPGGRIAMLAGGLGGQLGGGWLAPRIHDGRIAALTLSGGQAWALSNAAIWGIWANRAFETGTQADGVALLAYGLNSAGALAAPALLDLRGGQVLLAGSGALWGSWSAWGYGLARGTPEEGHALTTAVMGEIGLIGATAAGQLGWSPSALQVMIIDASGVVGGITGLVVDIQGGDRGMATAALVGSGAGLVAGGIVASRFHPRRRGTARIGLPDLWRLPVRVGVAAAPWQDPEGGQGLYLELHASPAPSPSERPR